MDRFDGTIGNEWLRSILTRALSTQRVERSGNISVVLDADFTHGAFLGPMRYLVEDLATGAKTELWVYPRYRCSSCGATYATQRAGADSVPIVLLDCGHAWCPKCPPQYVSQCCDNCQRRCCGRCIHTYEHVLGGLTLCHPCSVAMLARAEELGLTLKWETWRETADSRLTSCSFSSY
jgi:hypothetical protein